MKATYRMGIDIGGTNVRFGLTDDGGIIINKKFTHFNSILGAERQVDYIKTGLKDFIEENKKYNILSVGVGIAGQIDDDSGSVLFSPNLGWQNVELKKILERETGLSVEVVNDLMAITYGEWKFGAGRADESKEGSSLIRREATKIKENSLICVFVGTGIGSGMVIGDKLIRGCSNTAGEIGHIVIVSGGRKCVCGNSGCLEAYAGGWGIAEIVKELAQKDGIGFKNIIELAGGIENITAKTVSDAYDKNDSTAKRIIKQTAFYLADGIINAVNLINPCVVILGGGVIEGTPDLFDMVKDETTTRALKASTKNLKILKPKLGKDAGIVGAAHFPYH